MPVPGSAALPPADGRMFDDGEFHAGWRQEGKNASAAGRGPVRRGSQLQGGAGDEEARPMQRNS